jgi:hypothetical protein
MGPPLPAVPIFLGNVCSYHMQSREDCVRGVNERIITICSEENFVLQAVGRILKKCLEDKAFEEYRTTSLAYTAGGSMISGMQVCSLLQLVERR